jgi:hypothetical protein
MSQLGGKIVYDSGANQSTVPSVNISLGFFSNKTFTSPVNPVIFSNFTYNDGSPLVTAIVTPTGTSFVTPAGITVRTISSDSKIITHGGYIGRFYVDFSGGNTSPFYFNISMSVLDSNSYFAIGTYTSPSTAPFGDPVNISLYLRNGIPSMIISGVSYPTLTKIEFFKPFSYTSSISVIATISSSALYSTVVNYVY